MPVCPKCGHAFDVSRFCTNCGHPVGAPVETPIDGPADDGDPWRDDTAERRADTAERPAAAAPTQVTGTPPPELPVLPPDEGPRFPLFADEVDSPEDDLVDRPDDRPVSSHRSERPWLAWVAGAVALLLVTGIGAWLLFGGGDSDADLVAGEPTNTPADKGPKDKPGKPKKQPTKPAAPGEPTDVASLATADVPATAASGTDFDGNAVRYEARNMLDGVPSTCWRMPGDGSGETITFELAEDTKLSQVGLINGYAKTDTDGSGVTYDWYAGNRRILSVQWVFDDGSVVTQDLSETRKPQTLEIDPVTTSTVELRIVTVTPPGTGPARRDYTAISDISVIGTPA